MPSPQLQIKRRLSRDKTRLLKPRRKIVFRSFNLNLFMAPGKTPRESGTPFSGFMDLGRVRYHLPIVALVSAPVEFASGFNGLLLYTPFLSFPIQLRPKRIGWSSCWNALLFQLR